MPLRTVTRICAYVPCSKPFEIAPAYLKSGRGQYCSRACKGLASRMPPEQRFWLYVNKTETCWLWTGGMYPNGYGHFTVQQKPMIQMGAHRYSFILANGPIPDDILVCHDCPDGQDNRACIHPDHLYPGTYSDNNTDTIRKGRRNPISDIGTPKLTPEQVVEIWNLKESDTLTAIGTQYGVSPITVWSIWHKERWKKLLAQF